MSFEAVEPFFVNVIPSFTPSFAACAATEMNLLKY